MAKAKHEKHGRAQGNKKDKKAVEKKMQAKKPERVKGSVPESYAPRKARVNYVHDLFIRNVDTLTNGIFDKEQYLVGDAEFVKEMVPLFKGAPAGVERVVVKFVGAPVGHELILSGVQPGTSIPVKTLNNPMFVCKVKVVEVYKAIHALWKYLRKYMEGRAVDNYYLKGASSKEKKVDLSHLVGASVATRSIQSSESLKEQLERKIVSRRIITQFDHEFVWEGEGGLVGEPAEVISFTPIATKVGRVKEVSAVVQYPTDPKLIWEGARGIFEFEKMLFRVTPERIKNDVTVMVIYVHRAEVGTPLYGVKKNVYLPVNKLKKEDFSSALSSDNETYKAQKRIWDFLESAMREKGIKVKNEAKDAKPAPKAVEVTKPEMALENLALIGTVVDSVDRINLYQGSAEIHKLAYGSLGEYVIGNIGARSLVKVHNRRKGFLVAELVRSEEGSTLHGRCENGTFIFHGWLAKEASEIVFGENSEKKKVLHSFLSGVISRFKKEAPKGVTTDHVHEVEGNIRAPQYGRKDVDVYPEHATPQ